MQSVFSELVNELCYLRHDAPESSYMYELQLHISTLTVS